MNIIETVPELRKQVSQWKKKAERIALVPTMGNLHEGHLALVTKARSVADRVIVSIFVNPMQFGPNEDFGKYPRTFADDSEKLAKIGADMLFFPGQKEIYPFGTEASTEVSVPGLSDILCGEFRPGHFLGVTTVVNKFFNATQADVAVFGEKDFQQLFLIRRMVADLLMPIEILSRPTVRESDGLAKSSRNQYLNAPDRVLAAQIYKELTGAAEKVRAGRVDYETVCAESLASLEKQGFRPQYFSIRRAEDLAEAVPGKDRDLVILVAAYLGNTRLIDNCPLKLQ